jgi:cell division protein FtsQ
MRINWNFIKGLFLLGLVVFLYAFSSFKNKSRPVSKITVQFTGNDNVYITTEMVNKLLIQNQEQLYILPKDNLDLKEMEFLLESDDMIKSAQVYLTVNGEVRAKVEQKRPIARVHAETTFYIDEDGFWMPLSPQHSARVPLITGVVDKEDLNDVYTLALKIFKDSFLKTYITEIHQDENHQITLKMRLLDFEIFVGSLDNLDQKMKNLKAFYQKANKDKVLDIYKSVNLQFDNQVVCTKK